MRCVCHDSLLRPPDNDRARFLCAVRLRDQLAIIALIKPRAVIISVFSCASIDEVFEPFQRHAGECNFCAFITPASIAENKRYVVTPHTHARTREHLSLPDHWFILTVHFFFVVYRIKDLHKYNIYIICTKHSCYGYNNYYLLSTLCA